MMMITIITINPKHKLLIRIVGIVFIVSSTLCFYSNYKNSNHKRSANEDEVKVNMIKRRLNDLVDVIVGTGIGVPGNKAEPFKGLFKGVVGTVRGVEFLVKPLVSGNGRSLQIPQSCVFKINVFGTCVLGKRTTRYFSALQPAQQERSVALTLTLALSPSLTLNLSLTLTLTLRSFAV